MNDDDPQARAAELAAEGDHASAVIWRLITDAIEQLASTTPWPGALT